MKLVNQFILSIAFILVTILSLNAQQNFTKYNMDYLGSAHYLNPAFAPNGKAYISFGLGMNSFGLSNSGFNVSDAFERRASDDSLVISPTNLLSKLGKNNVIAFETYNELLGIGFRVKKKNYISLSVTNRTALNMVYTKDLVQFAVEGNGGEFMGNRMSLDNTAINANGYLDFSIGYNREVNKKLQVGGRFKVLSGYANVITKESRLGLTTNEETYAISIDGSMNIQTAGVKFLMDSTSTFQFSNALFKNVGFGLDLGAVYKITDKISVSASLVDFGFINWKSETAAYKVNDFHYTFEGVELKNFFKDSTGQNNTDRMLDEFKDTLGKIFKVDENNDSYRTFLTSRFYLSGKYTFNKYLSTSATLYSEILNNSYRASVIVAANFRLLNWLGITVNYSNYARSKGTVGVGLALRAGPIQFFVVTDNIIAPFAYFQTKNFHASFGFNLLIGKPNKIVKTAVRIY